MPLRLFLAYVDSRDLSEYMAIALIEGEERKQAELAARAKESEQRFRSRRPTGPRGGRGGYR